MNQSSTGLPDNVANFIAYLFAWISGLLMLVIEKDSETVRFHAAQSVTIFGSLTILNLLLPFVPVIGPLLLGVLAPVTVLAWIILLVMSVLGSAPRVPIIENFAEQILRQFRKPPPRIDYDD